MLGVFFTADGASFRQSSALSEVQRSGSRRHPDLPQRDLPHRGQGRGHPEGALGGDQVHEDVPVRHGKQEGHLQAQKG